MKKRILLFQSDWEKKKMHSKLNSGPLKMFDWFQYLCSLTQFDFCEQKSTNLNEYKNKNKNKKQWNSVEQVNINRSFRKLFIAKINVANSKRICLSHVSEFCWHYFKFQRTSAFVFVNLQSETKKKLKLLLFNIVCNQIETLQSHHIRAINSLLFHWFYLRFFSPLLPFIFLVILIKWILLEVGGKCLPQWQF